MRQRAWWLAAAGYAVLTLVFVSPLVNYAHLADATYPGDARLLVWTLAWDGWTAGAVVSGALEDQVVIPVRFPLPDLNARYLRIHPAPIWLIQELRVLGP